MSVEGHGVGGRSEEEVASALQRKLQLGEAKLDEEEQAAQAADKQPNNSSDDSTTQTPSKLSSASSTGSLKKLSAKAKAFVPTPSPPPAAAASRSKPLLPTSASQQPQQQPQQQQQHADPFTPATLLYTDPMQPANPDSIPYFKPIVQTLLSTDHIYTDPLLLKAMLLDPLQQRCIPLAVLAQHPVLVNNGYAPLAGWDILYIVRHTPGWEISAHMDTIRPTPLPLFNHRELLQQSVYIQMPKSVHLQDLHNLLQVINSVPGVQAVQAYPASLLLAVSNQLPFVDRRQDQLTLDIKTRDAFVVLQQPDMVKTLMQAVDQAKQLKKAGKQTDKAQQTALPPSVAGVLPHMTVVPKAEHLLNLVNAARNEQRKQNKPKPTARRQKADETNAKTDWRSASPAPMSEDKQVEAVDDIGEQMFQLMLVDQATVVAAAAANRPAVDEKQSSVVAPPSQAAIARKKLYTLTKDVKGTTSNFAIGSDDDKGFAADSRLRSKLLLRIVAQPVTSAQPSEAHAATVDTVR